MEFSLKCSCGETLAAQPAQAGMTIVCRCGALVQVPSLGRLRALAGMPAYETSTIDVIGGMVSRGELPAAGRCVISGEPTDDVIELQVEAERIFAAPDNLKWAFLAAACISPLLILVALGHRRPPDFGRETVVPTPLRVATAFHARVRSASQRDLKRWLRSVPIYSKLMDEYPRTTVRIAMSA